MWNWLFPGSSKRLPKSRVTWTDDGFVVHFSNRDVGLNWSDVQLVKAWKEDCLTFDSIVVAFFASGDREVAVPEEFENFTEFLDAAGQHLPGFNWWIHFNEVAFPAFQTNLTTVWTRQTTHLASS